MGLPWIQEVWFQQLSDGGNVKPSSIPIHLQKLKIQDLLAMGLRNGGPWTLDLNRSGEGGRPESPGFYSSARKSWEPWFPPKQKSWSYTMEPGDPESPGWGYSVRSSRNLAFTEKSSDVILRAHGLRPGHAGKRPTAANHASPGRSRGKKLIAVTVSLHLLVPFISSSEPVVSQHLQGEGGNLAIKFRLKLSF